MLRAELCAPGRDRREAVMGELCARAELKVCFGRSCVLRVVAVERLSQEQP